jgi:hypothetical protein
VTESVKFEYNYEDEDGHKTISLGKEEAQMEVMAVSFLDFFTSVFSVDYEFAANRIIDALTAEVPIKGYDPSIDLKRAAWDVYTAGRQVAEGEAHMEELQTALDEMGELIPVERP